jgi:hypothetical protein
MGGQYPINRHGTRQNAGDLLDQERVAPDLCILSQWNVCDGMKTIRQYYRVDRRQINMVRFILEAYEGVGTVTTLDAASGRIVIFAAPGCETIVQAVMADLGKKFLVEPCGMPTEEAHNHV